MEQKSNISTVRQDQSPTPMVGTADLLFSPGMMESLVTFANFMSEGSATVPNHLAGKPADCAAVVMQAAQWRMNPFAVAQKTHLVNGTLGYEAQLVNAVLKSSNAIAGRFHYEYQGDGSTLECRVGAVINGETDVTWNEWLKISHITTKNSPLWKTNPKQQLGYLQVKNWARLYCPEAIMGVYTPDELQEIPSQPEEKDITPVAADLNAAISGNDVNGEVVDAEAPDPQQMIDAIWAAENPDALAKAIEAVDQLDRVDMATVRAAYGEKVAQVKAARQSKAQAQSEGPVITFATVADDIAKASNEDELAEAESLISSVKNSAHQDELIGRVKVRRQELSGGDDDENFFAGGK